MLMHLQHGEKEHREKRSIVQSEEGGAVLVPQLLGFGQKNGSGKDQPITGEEINALPETPGWVGPLPMRTVEKSPEAVSRIRGSQADEGETGPAISEEEENGSTSEHEIGIQREEFNAGDHGSVVSEQDRKQSQDF